MLLRSGRYAQDAAMDAFRPWLSSTLLVAAGLLAVPCLAAEVTIYRCVGPGGQLTLRDSPCAPGERQEVRAMQRPTDPAPMARPLPTPASASVAPAREVQIVYRNAPRPLYECVDNEGRRYTSDNGEGNPRAVPLWTLGYSGWSRNGGGRGHGGRPSGDAHAPRPGYVVPAGSAWIRDECHPLPQQEVCDRLSDRRYEIIRRYNSALQSERRALELEQRGIDARIANDCGNP